MAEQSGPDPLADPAFRAPGIRELIKEAFGGRPRLLDWVQIEVTTRCPGHCLYCPHTTRAAEWRSVHMDARVFAALWPLLRRSGRAHLQGWGEPLLHPRFFDFVALARRAGCRVSTTTCGLRMDVALAEKIVASGIDIIAFSLSGTDAHADACRRGVDFEQVLAAVRLLQEVRRRRGGVHLEVHIAYLLLASRADSLLGLPDLLEATGAHAAVVSTLDYLPDPQWQAEAFAPHETDKIAAVRAVLEKTAAQAARQGRSIFYALPAPKPMPGCREQADRSLFVGAEGDIAPCVYLNLPVSQADPRRLVFGNVLHNDPLSLWNDPRYVAFREALRRGERQGPCATCVKRFEAC